MTLRPLWNACIALLVAASVQAQVIRGQVRDSASERGIPGVVVEALDRAGRMVRRSVTDDAGRFGMGLNGTETTLRAVRIGYHPVSARLGGEETVTLHMARLPNLLDPVQITAARNCPRGWNNPSSLGLLDQARAALLNSVVSADINGLAMKRLQFERTFAADTIAYQSVRIDVAERTPGSYAAVRPAEEFISKGFVAPDGNDFTYYSPDANTLLDSAFSRAYCFKSTTDRLRPREVALQFGRPESGRNRVDIRGKIWIDTVSRVLVSLDFQYEGLGALVDPGEPGGTVHFQELPNGMTVIDRWWLRLVTPDRFQFGSRRRYQVSETGGEVARFTLSDGRTVESGLGTASLLVRNPFGRPMPHQEIFLENTDYRGMTDDRGRAVIPHMLPGPYKVALRNPELDAVGIQIPTSARFKAERGKTTEGDVGGRSVRDFTYDRCKHDGIWNDLAKADSTTAWIVGRAVDEKGASLNGVLVTAAVPFGAEAKSIRSGTDGIFAICTIAIKVGDSVTISGNHHRLQAKPVMMNLTKTANVTPLLRFAPPEGD